MDAHKEHTKPRGITRILASNAYNVSTDGIITQVTHGTTFSLKMWRGHHAADFVIMSMARRSSGMTKEVCSTS